MTTCTPNVDVIDAVRSLFSDGGQTIIWYGSRRDDRDVDLLAIDDEATGTTSIRLGRVDLAALTRGQFDLLVGCADPVATEPVLTGVLIAGDAAVLDTARECLLGCRPPVGAVGHALRRSHEDSASVARFLEQYRDTKDLRCLRWALHNLSFAIAYLSFARRYSDRSATVCTLRELRDGGDIVLPEFWDWYDLVKHHARPTLADAEIWFSRWAALCVY